MKFRIKQNKSCELIGNLSYPQIRTILDDIPRECIKEIVVTIDEPEVFNDKEE